MYTPRVGSAVCRPLARTFSSAANPGAGRGPRHFLAIKDLSPNEFVSLVRTASNLKQMFSYEFASKAAPPKESGAGNGPPRDLLQGRSIAMMFNKLSTRTRVSTEVAVNLFGGHSMFLGKNDIQLGVNETVRDTACVLSEMVAGIFARVHEHSEVEELAKYAKVPVINALSTEHHPLQTIADFQTMTEALVPNRVQRHSLSLEGTTVAWIGDSNNVLFDLASGCMMSGMQINVAAPAGYGIPEKMRQVIKGCAEGANNPGRLFETDSPEEAVKGADVIVTDTWTSMGFEEETAKRLKAFEGYQVTESLAKRGGANPNWIFLHCLPRHQEEVDDEVFYGPRSLVFPEAQNRVWSASSALYSFVEKKGKIETPPDTSALRHGLTPSNFSGIKKLFP